MRCEQEDASDSNFPALFAALFISLIMVASVGCATNAGKRYTRVPGATALIWRVLVVTDKRIRKLDASELLANALAGQEYLNGNRSVT